MCVYVSACMYICACADAHRGKKRALGPLQLKLQVIVSCRMWVLGADWGALLCKSSTYLEPLSHFSLFRLRVSVSPKVSPSQHVGAL